MSDLRLPGGTVLLHVGPHKTGTTALQGALYYARPELAKHGVLYPGRRRQHQDAALAMTGHRGLRGFEPPTREAWDRLRRQVSRARGGDRVMVSSEFFGEADLEAAREIVGGLGGPRVHVLITLRPLTKIMPSAWQQYTRNGHVTTYADWLDGMLRREPFDKPTPSFWRRHHHDRLVAKWADVVGADRVTVLVVDENDRDMLTHTVEDLLGLPRGLLVPEPGRSNRSLTWGEIELVRRLNQEFRARAWPDQLYRTFVFPMTQHLQDHHRPAPDEPRIVTPRWALQRASEIGAQAADAIAGMGVRVIGDLTTLGTPPLEGGPDGPVADPPQVPVDVAKDAVVGVIAAAAERLPKPVDTGVEAAVPPRRDLSLARLKRSAGQLRWSAPVARLRGRRPAG